ncbi:MFS transporter [Spirulina major CS-329]|uniref:MFS transporter n=1 Tax=Spirulina TaxID=1154 RepID=UPI00232E7741|nr:MULTISPECIES: MFS transporter [Spirulina]MDB9493005.1 MFS transporter [Spirulina subsalsa CS-330]MDB9505225.1 MFS transporter [Spirulina major CS-329]
MSIESPFDSDAELPREPAVPLTLKTQLSYGVGEVSSEITGSILVFFWLYFLTNVVGLPPAQAGSVLIIARVWDAVLDPLVGWLSDQTRSRFGRRYPWMLGGAIPLGVSFAFLLWAMPSAPLQWRWLYATAMALVFYTAFTVVIVPYSTLGAELTHQYEERTRLVSVKASFTIGSSIAALILAQVIFGVIEDEVLKYQVLGGICGAIASLSMVICVWGTRDRFAAMQAFRHRPVKPPQLPIRQQIHMAVSNRPFLFVVGIYLCSWLGLQVTAAILPYFVVEWMGLTEQAFTQMALTVQGTAFLMMIFWRRLSLRLSKRAIYLWGVPLTFVAQLGLFTLQPGQTGLMYGFGILAGMGLSVAYLIPWSMLPDAVDFDELRTGQRREGIFYGLMVQMKKLAIAVTIFFISRLLDSSGFVTDNLSDPEQPASALWMIRLLIGPIPVISLVVGMILAAAYPLSQAVHGDIMLKLATQRRQPETPPEP